MIQRRAVGSVRAACALLIASIVATGAWFATTDDAGAQEAERPDADIFIAIARDASERASVALRGVDLLRTEPVTWNDICLGVSRPGEFCAPVLTPGFVVWVEAGGEASRYHTGLTAQEIRFATGGLDPATVRSAELPPGTHAPGEVVEPLTYTVRAGDTLHRIAQQFSRSVEAIAAENRLLDVNRIFAGQVLRIPAANGPPPSPPPAPAPPAQPPPEPAMSYVVRPGDTLTLIAARFGATVPGIASANNIANIHRIWAGQVLAIPGATAAPAPPKPPKPPDASTYRVQPGDTLTRIARQFNTTVHGLAAKNHIANPHLIFAGQVLRIA